MIVPNILSSELEVWGGAEYTYNRVGETYFDQSARSGHDTRIGDLDLFAALGIKALRYPVLWERTAPGDVRAADWTWADARLARLRALSVRPIVGLVHHGSGPRHTNLRDPAFAEGLATYAGAVAGRYPWVMDYTPVNEPLTTARFSGLYGHWYPHATDPVSFARMLLTQCRATVLAMRAIRRVNPAARLVQTDDLGKTFAVPELAYQADHENERRWLTFDILCGRLNRDRPMWHFFRWLGIGKDEMAWFEANPCPPDIIGINHYMTSERFLDTALERYPPQTHGNNGRQAYADVEAVRVRAGGLAGLRALLTDVWERYHLPIAVTEAHLGCTREEQMRWLRDVWAEAQTLRGDGVAVRAVTAWALLGSYDWDSLVTRDEGHYETGVFDLRGGTPRPTALTAVLRDFAAGRTPAQPVLNGRGWWQRPQRLIYGVALDDAGQPQPLPRPDDMALSAARPILIVGATGTLGQAFAAACQWRGLSYRLLNRRQVDITEPASVAAALDRSGAWAVVNAAGYVRVDAAENEPDVCLRVNADGAANLAEECARRGIALLTFSSDLVFDGRQTRPYVESDPAAPLNVYGRRKAEAERRVLAALPAALVVRTAAFFGPDDAYNFVTVALREIAAGRAFVAADDAVVSPTCVPDLVSACLDLLIDGERGIWHIATPGATTWADLARTAAALAGLDAALVVGRPTAALGLAAPRPHYSVLGSERAVLLPPLADALARYVRERWPAPATEPLLV